MKKTPLLIAFLFFIISCYSQITFEKGYYIDNSGKKVDCLIKNIDWKNNPLEFEYKLTENSEQKTATINTTKEFGVYNAYKFLRATVLIDRSSHRISELNNDRNPIFNKEKLFLKVLVQGQANLYSYADHSLIRYFYNKDNKDIEQLIYKKFKTTNLNIRTNSRFKQQLLNELKCKNINSNKIKNTAYAKKDLVKLFIEYNNCTNSLSFREEKSKRDFLNITIRPRLNNSSLSIKNTRFSSLSQKFDDKTGIGIGIEFEYILPFNKNKWGVLIEPTYQSYKEENIIDSENTISGGKMITTVDYSSIEIPISLRHYFFLNNNSKIFANVSFVYDLSSKTSADFKRIDDSLIDSVEVNSFGNLAFGIGYKFKNKYCIEVRTQTNRDILGSHHLWSSNFRSSSIIFGYSIF